jgi:thymidylate synthase
MMEIGCYVVLLAEAHEKTFAYFDGQYLLLAGRAQPLMKHELKKLSSQPIDWADDLSLVLLVTPEIAGFVEPPLLPYQCYPETAHVDVQYLTMAHKVLQQGRQSDNRTSTSSIKLGGYMMQYDLRKGFPLLSSKFMGIKNIMTEDVWLLNGHTNVKILHEDDCHIWDEWATPSGELGPVYGEQWVRWCDRRAVHQHADPKTHDYLKTHGYQSAPSDDGEIIHYEKKINQLQELIDSLKHNPHNRRMLVTAWNPGLTPDPCLLPNENAAAGQQALPPCHTFFQCLTAPMTREERVDVWLNQEVIRHAEPLSTAESHARLLLLSDEDVDEKLNRDHIPHYFLDLLMYQRSGDVFLGVPYNIASYAAVTLVLAQLVNMVPRNYTHFLADYHVYTDHVSQLQTQLEQPIRPMPTMTIKPFSSLDELTVAHFELHDYTPGIRLKGKVAV